MIKETFSPEETLAFGEELGKNAKPGQVYTCLLYTSDAADE